MKQKPTTKYVPVLKETDSFGVATFTVEHKDGSKAYFFAEEGEHEQVRKQAEKYRKAGLKI